MSDEQENREQSHSIGRIPLKQVRVKKDESEKPANPMNLLVPYLDLFARLDDEELSRLSGTTEDVVAELRKQVITIDEALGVYADLLPRLSDGELVRLTGATARTIRFWRLCQPRVPLPKDRPSRVDDSVDGAVVARAAAAKASTGPVPAAHAPVPTPVASPPPEGVDKEVADPVARPVGPPVQATVSRLMTFSGDPFPGFDESAPGFDAVPSPEELDLALEELEDG